MEGWRREAREEIEKQIIEEPSSFPRGLGDGNAKHKYTIAAKKQRVVKHEPVSLPLAKEQENPGPAKVARKSAWVSSPNVTQTTGSRA